MKNRILILAVVVLTAIFIGVTITVQQMTTPITEKMLRQQQETIISQRNMREEFKAESERLARIEEKMNALETGLRPLIEIARRTQAQQGRQRQMAEDYNKEYEIPIGNSPVKGNPDAPVTIVEFIDLQCPFCGRFHPILEQVRTAYPEQVNYVLKHFPLQMHPQAIPAAKAVLAAGEQGKYWEMVEKIVDNQRQLSEENYIEWAGELGLDKAKFQQDYTERADEWEELIKSEYELGLKVAVRGTPSFYINGKKTMARDLDSFKAEIEKILSEKSDPEPPAEGDSK